MTHRDTDLRQVVLDEQRQELLKVIGPELAKIEKHEKKVAAARAVGSTFWRSPGDASVAIEAPRSPSKTTGITLGRLACLLTGMALITAHAVGLIDGSTALVLGTALIGLPAFGGRLDNLTEV